MKKKINKNVDRVCVCVPASHLKHFDKYTQSVVLHREEEKKSYMLMHTLNNRIHSICYYEQ